MIESGELVAVGGGRARRYRKRMSFTRVYATLGLEEHLVWRDLVASVVGIAEAESNVREILNYTVTETLGVRSSTSR